LIGHTQVVYMDSLADSGQARFIAWMREDLANISPARRRGVLYEVGERVRISSAQRSQISSLFRERHDALRHSTSGYALVTSSMIVRGMLSALYWFAPPPYPYCIEAQLEPAFAFLASRDRNIDAEITLQSYSALKFRLGY
jgi:hypothetical protein